MTTFDKNLATNHSQINRMPGFSIILMLLGCLLALCATVRTQEVAIGNKNNFVKLKVFPAGACRILPPGALRKPEHEEPEYVAKAINILKDTTQEFSMRIRAADFLWGLSSAEGDQILRDVALNDLDVDVRAAAVSSLMRNLGEEPFEFLDKVLKDAAPRIREEVAFSLCNTPHNKTMALLIKFLQTDESPLVRGSAASSLGFMKKVVRKNPIGNQDKLTEALIAALKDSAPNVRAAAISSLGAVLGEKSFEFLEQGVKDRDATVRATAFSTLKIVLGEKSFEFLALAAKDLDPIVRTSAATNLGYLQNKEATALLINLLQNDINADVRLMAANKLGFNPLVVRKNTVLEVADSKEALIVDTLINALTDSSPSVRLIAASGLENLKARKAIKPLVELLAREKDQVLRFEVEQKLKRLRTALAEESGHFKK